MNNKKQGSTWNRGQALVWLVSTNTRTLQFSASIAIVLAVLVSLPGIFWDCHLLHGKNAAMQGVKNVGSMILNSLEAGGRGCITVAVACAMAGMVAGCLLFGSSSLPEESYIVKYTAGWLITVILLLICMLVFYQRGKRKSA